MAPYCPAAAWALRAPTAREDGVALTKDRRNAVAAKGMAYARALRKGQAGSGVGGPHSVVTGSMCSSVHMGHSKFSLRASSKLAASSGEEVCWQGCWKDRAD